MGTGLIAVTIVGLCLLFLVVWLVSRHEKRHERARQSARWEQWEAMRSRRASIPGAELAEVSDVYQRARHGTKAVITWIATGHRQDTWFENFSPEAGAVVLIRGSTGWGPHNQNPNVFYVRHDQVLDVLPAGTRNALIRQHKREVGRDGRRVSRRRP